MTPNLTRMHHARGIVARTVLPGLAVGDALPSAASLTAALGCTRVAAWRHLRGAMADAGVVVRLSSYGKRGGACLVVDYIPREGPL